VTQLQRLLFRHWPQLQDLALANCGTVERRDELRRGLGALSDDELSRLAVTQLRLADAADPWAARREFLEVCPGGCSLVKGAAVGPSPSFCGAFLSCFSFALWAQVFLSS
jgi:hypothetical protein